MSGNNFVVFSISNGGTQRLVMAKVFSNVRYYINCIKWTRFSYQRENKLNNNKSQTKKTQSMHIAHNAMCALCALCSGQVPKCRQAKCRIQHAEPADVICITFWFLISFSNLFSFYTKSEQRKQTNEKIYEEIKTSNATRQRHIRK